MEKSLGTYALILEARSVFELTVGKLGRLSGRPGYYVYVGSAFGPGGVKARLKHHRQSALQPHWHIDYLRLQLPFNEVWYTHDLHKRECEWAKLMAGMPGAKVPFAGFGASDCTCTAHLIYFEQAPSFRAFRKRLSFSKVKHAPVRRVSYTYLTEL
jgi:Uri superfamily endonuclease